MSRHRSPLRDRAAFGELPRRSLCRARSLAAHLAARSNTTLRTWRVADDWPARVPVTDAEVDVFEAWFGDLFDELFGPRR